MKKRIVRTIWFIALCFVLIVTWPDFVYSIYVDNVGQNGVVITKMSYMERRSKRFGAETLRVVHLEYPQFPGTDPSREPDKFDQYHFPGLPGEVEVEWQLAELSECDDERTSLAYPGHVSKSGCRWTPISGKVYRKVFDMDDIRDTPEYQRTGAFYEGIACSRHVLDLHFVFREDDLQLKAYNSVTNPWK